VAKPRLAVDDLADAERQVAAGRTRSRAGRASPAGRAVGIGKGIVVLVRRQQQGPSNARASTSRLLAADDLTAARKANAPMEWQATWMVGRCAFGMAAMARNCASAAAIAWPDFSASRRSNR
jgi:hypothetical protein